MRDEQGLERLKSGAVRKALNCRYGLSVMHHGKRQARVNATSFQQNGTRSALTVIATFLRAGQGQMLTQRVKQGSTRIEGYTVLMTVDQQFDSHRRSGWLRIGHVGGKR
jgi:hypothetical protein